MITISESLVAPRPVDDVFALVSDFGRIADWDPNVVSSRRDGPLSVGAVAKLRVAFGPRPVPMDYTLEVLEPAKRAVWRGENATSVATDDIEVTEAPGGGTLVHWRATLAFKGPLGLFDRTARRGFERIGRTTIEALARALSSEDFLASEPPQGPGASVWSALAMGFDAAVAPSFGAPGYLARRKTWADPDISIDLTGRHVVVTGANSGLGKATAKALLERGADVTMVCRSAERGARALEEVSGASGHARLELADMGDLERVEALGRRLLDGPAIHGVIHNAGALLAERQRSPQGHELTFAVHVLGPHLLTRWLEPALVRAQDARLVFVSSGGMYTQKLDVDQLADGLKRYDGATVYAQAKRAQVYMAERWAKRLGHEGVAVSSMHPGWADTRGVRDALPRFREATRTILRSAEQGADTIVWLAASHEGSMARGGFYLDREPRRTHAPMSFTRSSASDVDRLWAMCEELSGAFLPS